MSSLQPDITRVIIIRYLTSFGLRAVLEMELSLQPAMWSTNLKGPTNDTIVVRNTDPAVSRSNGDGEPRGRTTERVNKGDV